MIMEKNGAVHIKECFVQLEMLNLAEYDSDSSIDLPVPTYLRPSKKKSKLKKTSEELLLESQNLADNIDIDIMQNNDMEEKIRTLEIVQNPEPDDESSTPPLLKEEDFHVFYVKDSLQFFSKLDVTPSLCGYKNRIAFTAFEKTILATKNVELEHVISSFLFSSNVYCISDCKSFVTYLLKNLSIYEDVATINACYNVLNMLLTKHADAKNLAFSTAEIFMLLFNYGVDINSFQFLQQWSDVINHLEVPTKCNSSGIPKNWTLNLKKILKAVIKLLSTCTFKAEDLCKISVFFLWMCLDSTLVQENLYSVIKECISVCLNRITKDVWIKTLCDIARIILSMEFSSEKEKWKNIAYMTEAIPVDSEKGIQLRKQISFLVLNSICKGNRKPEIEDRFGFNLSELQDLLRKLKEIDTNLMSSATKFVDICIRHLNTTTEEYQDLLKNLKHSESHLDETAHEAKRHFATIHFKLSLLVGNNFKMYQVSPHKRTPRKGTPKKIKAEGIEALSEDKLISFDLRKVKLEPASDINRGLRPIENSPNKTNLACDEINDATIQNDRETNLESSNEQHEEDISDSLLLISKNVVVKKERNDCSYSENSEIFDASENLELTSTNIIVKKERIDEESYPDSETNEEFSKCSNIQLNVEELVDKSRNLQLMSSNIIVEKEHIDNDDYLENNEVLFENSIVEVNVEEKVNDSNNLDLMLNNTVVKKEHTDEDNSETHADEFVDIEEQQSDSSGDDEQLASFNVLEENINSPVIFAKGSICDTNSVNVSVDVSSGCLTDKIVDNIAVTQVAICDSNVQESCIDSNLGMKDSRIALVSSISTEEPIVIEAFSVAGSELIEVDKSSHLSQDLAHISAGDNIQEEDNATLHLRDESKSILIAEDFEIAQKSPHKGFGYDSSKMDGNGEESEVTELTMLEGEKNYLNISPSYETKLTNDAGTEVALSHWIETCMDEEIFKDGKEEVHIHSAEILNDVLSSVDAMTDICVDISANEALDDESSAMTIRTGHYDLNINADTENVLNNQENSVLEQNKCISSTLKTKQRSRKNSYSSMSKDLKSARKKVLMKRKYSSLDWCKSLTKKYKVKHIPMQKRIKQFNVHNIDRDVANTLESVVISSVASCQPPTSLRKSMSNSVVERSKSFVQEFNSSITVRESSDLTAVKGFDGKELSIKKYPLGKILFGEHSMLNETRSCPSTPVHFSGEHINRKRKLSDSHELSSSLMTNNFVSKLKALDDESLVNQKKSRQSVIVSPKKSLMKFSQRRPPLKFSPKKSPHKYFDYMQRKQKYVSFSRQKHQSLLSKTGANLAKILREKLIPDASSDKVQTVVSLSSDESDSDVVELYVDPKRFADKECMIIYESPEQIVIDSD